MEWRRRRELLPELEGRLRNVRNWNDLMDLEAALEEVDMVLVSRRNDARVFGFRLAQYPRLDGRVYYVEGRVEYLYSNNREGSARYENLWRVLRVA